MTIQHLVDTLTEFKEEYQSSSDREVRRMCGFISNTIEILNAYARFFTFSKENIEKSQEYYAAALETLNKLLLEENGEAYVPPEGGLDIPNLPDPGIPDTDSAEDDIPLQFIEEDGLTLEQIANNTES